MYREEWLSKGLSLLNARIFRPHKYKLATDIRVSCGWPSSKAVSLKQRTIGQCWYPIAGSNHELFISPTLDDPVRVLDVLTHEIVHTLVGSAAAHGSKFKYVALRVGLEGKMTATVAGPELEARLKLIAEQLGPYPHKAIAPPLRVRPVSSTVKGECPSCGYVARVPAAWVAEAGLPVCPACDLPLSAE